MKLVRNFTSLAGAEATSKLLTFASFAYLARVAGPERYGYLEYAGAALFCAGLLVEQGFGFYGAREIAKSPERTRQLVSEIVLARLMIAVCAYAILIGFAFLIDHPPLVTRLLLAYGASLLLLPLLLPWVFQGHDRMGIVAIAQLIRQTVFAVVIFAFVRDSSQIIYAAIAEVAGVCSAATFGLIVYLRKFGLSHQFQFISRRLIREGVPIGLGQIFWVTRYFGSTLIVGMYATSAGLGYFTGALRILLAVHTFVWLYYFNLFPWLSRAWQQDPDSFIGLICRSLHFISWGGFLGLLLWVLLAPTAVVIIYGQSFAPAGRALQVFAGVCMASLLSGHYRYSLTAAGLQSTEMAISAMGSIVAIIAIPIGYSYFGLTGAACGLLSAELTVWQFSWLAGRRLLGLHGHLALLCRPIIATVAAASLTLLTRALILPLKLLATTAIFLLLLWLTESTVRQAISSAAFKRA